MSLDVSSEKEVKAIAKEVSEDLYDKLSELLINELKKSEERVTNQIEIKFGPKIDERVTHKLGNFTTTLYDCLGTNLNEFSGREKLRKDMEFLHESRTSKEQLGKTIKDKILDKLIAGGIVLVFAALLSYLGITISKEDKGNTTSEYRSKTVTQQR